MSKLLVDRRCVELAEHFAYGEDLTSAETADLSEEIQRSVDGWFNERNARVAAAPSPYREQRQRRRANDE